MTPLLLHCHSHLAAAAPVLEQAVGGVAPLASLTLKDDPGSEGEGETEEEEEEEGAEDSSAMGEETGEVGVRARVPVCVRVWEPLCVRTCTHACTLACAGTACAGVGGCIVR